MQEFVDSAVDGVSLLLELLRTVQLQQQGGQGGGGVAVQRQALLQENACLQCLHGCLRCHDAPRRLAVSSAGLFTLAVSTMSSVNKSRVLALQVCIHWSGVYPIHTQCIVPFGFVFKNN